MKITAYLTSTLILVLSVFYTGTSVAALAEKRGFTGQISVITGYAQQTSNLNTEGDKLQTGNLNQKGSSEREFLVAPLGSVQYTFGSDLDKQVFIGTSQEDITVGDVGLGIEIGYSQELSSGMVMSFSYLPSVISGETWQDPYLLDSDKQSTDISGNAVRVQLSSIVGSNFSLDLAYVTTDIDDEQSGRDFSLSEQKLLARNGHSVYLKSAYQYELDQTSGLIPSLTYISHSADGQSMSFNSYGGDLTYFKIIEGHKIALTAAYSYAAYDAVNPVFNKKREDNAYSLFAAYEQRLGFGLEDWSFISLLGYSRSVSNIEFYDENGFLALLGVKYNF